MNNIGISNQENRYRIKKYKEYDIDNERNTIGLKKPSTGYYKTEGNYGNNNERNVIESNNYYLYKVPEAI